MAPDTIPLLLLIGIAAALYSAVGQGGGSGYLAAMVFIGLAPAVMKPSALAMNVAVTGMSLCLFRNWRDIPLRLFWPLVFSSVPVALLGGYYLPSGTVYAYLVGGSLFIAALALFRSEMPTVRNKTPSWPTLVVVGAVLGLVSGLSGVGGGIFLAPIVLLAGWAGMEVTMSLTAAFIFLNSAAALVGFGFSDLAWPSELPGMIAAALLGAGMGITLARRYLGSLTLQRVLGLVLLFAAIRMIWMA